MDSTKSRKLEQRSGRKDLERLYRELTRGLEAKTRSILGTPSIEISKYSEALQKDLLRFPKTPELISRRSLKRKDLLRLILKQDFTLVGDFHPHPQTQREFLRIAREVHPLLEGRRLVLGLEFVSTENQPLLNRFMEGKINETELLHSLQFEEKWGISQDSFRSLLTFARTLRNTELLALNAPEELQRRRPPQMSDLEYRDRWCAGVLLERSTQLRPQDSHHCPLILALYGELHLASQHLPLRIQSLAQTTQKKKSRILVIHQNLEPIFWKLMSAGLDHDLSLLMLKENDPSIACIFSSPPWTRHQSVLDWLETTPESSFVPDDDPKDETESDWDWIEDEIDLLSRFEHSFRFLEKAFGIAHQDLSRVEVYSSDQLSKVTQRLERLNLPPNEKAWQVHRLKKGEKLSLPKAGLIFIPAPISPHRFAEVCGEMIFQTTHFHSSTALKAKRLNEWRCLEASFAYFCSKITNPKRKCDAPGDHLRKMNELRKNQRPPQFEGELEVRARVIEAIASFQKIESSFQRTPGSLRERYQLSRTCSWIGKILGEVAYRALARGHVSLPDLLTLYLRTPSIEEALQRLLKWTSTELSPEEKHY